MPDSDQIPMPDEFDDEEESPYRRRQKAIEVRRNRVSRRWRQIFRWALWTVFALLPIGLGGYELAAFVLSSGRFRVDSATDIAVEGNQYAGREEILAALGIAPIRAAERGPNILRVSLEEEKKRVESVPWVRSATLARAFPNRVAVFVVEREPVAFVNFRGQLKLADSEGVLLEKPEKGNFDFPVLTGLDATGGSADRQSRVALYQQFSRELASDLPSSGWLVSEVDVSDPEDLKALLIQGAETILVHFGRTNFEERFRNFVNLLPEIRKTNAKIDSIDLRYRNQIVVNPVNGPARQSALPQKE